MVGKCASWPECQPADSPFPDGRAVKFPTSSNFGLKVKTDQGGNLTGEGEIPHVAQPYSCALNLDANSRYGIDTASPASPMAASAQLTDVTPANQPTSRLDPTTNP